MISDRIWANTEGDGRMVLTHKNQPLGVSHTKQPTTSNYHAIMLLCCADHLAHVTPLSQVCWDYGLDQFRRIREAFGISEEEYSAAFPSEHEIDALAEGAQLRRMQSVIAVCRR